MFSLVSIILAALLLVRAFNGDDVWAAGPVEPQVAAGWKHIVGLKLDSTVVAAGHNYYSQCEVGGWLLYYYATEVYAILSAQIAQQQQTIADLNAQLS